jgi:hypothetical protein
VVTAGDCYFPKDNVKKYDRYIVFTSDSAKKL